MILFAANANGGQSLVAPMQDEEFWALIELIDGARTSDENTDLSALEASLSELGPQEIASFYEALAQKAHLLDTKAHYRGFSWFPGLSDTFLYSRLSVIAQGQENYEYVLENPKKFPSRSTKWFEGLLYVADNAYFLATSTEFERQSSVSIESFQNAKGWGK